MARTIFRLDDSRITPAHRLYDNVDFVPARKDFLFGHHFTSIAGTGPIVGPAIGVIWGWLPALIWVVIGPVLIGAVHDFGSLVLSIRNNGSSLAEVMGKTVSHRIRFLFFIIIFFELWMVIAVFALIIALLFVMYPNSVLAVWIEIPIALWLGRQVRRGGANLFNLSLIGVVLMYLAVFTGAYLPIRLPTIFQLSPVLLWMIILFVYAFIASIVPVDRLLQPRDYLNSHQLLIAIGLLILGLVVVHPPMSAPAYIAQPPGAPAMWPFLFVVIACGAVSGFHSMVGSGTTSKQLNRESDALFIGYGSMLLEGTLAVLVILACTAGLGMGITDSDGSVLIGHAAFLGHYSSWNVASGLGAKLSAFIEGSANLIVSLGLTKNIAVTVMTVFIVSFAATTLDSATRIQRYVVVELAETSGIKTVSGRLPATLIAVGSAMALAFYSGDGRGAMTLWPIFGGVNQLLASLALLAIISYLVHQARPIKVVVPPMIFMVIVTAWAMAYNAQSLWYQGNYLLAGLSLFIIALQVWVLFESVMIVRRRTAGTGGEL